MILFASAAAAWHWLLQEIAEHVVNSVVELPPVVMNGTSASSVYGLPLVAMSEAAASEVPYTGDVVYPLTCFFAESGQSYAVYRFVISVNPMDITELNATLGNYILHEPVKAAKIFQSVCDAAIRTLSLIGEYQAEVQINVILKVTHLPDLPGYHLRLCEFPLDYRSQRLYMTEGTVIAMSTVNKYTQGARFLCSDTQCPLSRDFRYIRIHTPGATESATVRQDFFCDLCASPLKEDVKYRVLGDKQVIEFMDSKILRIFQGQRASHQNYRFQSYAVCFSECAKSTLSLPGMMSIKAKSVITARFLLCSSVDELIDRMKIGGRYRVIGIPVCGLNGSRVTVCIEANNFHQYIASYPHTICKAFQKLHLKTLSSPWIFTGILANIFAAQVVPVGMHNTLKLCLLLSLVQTCNEDKDIGNPLDLMVVTNDTMIVERLMRYSICLIPRGVHHTHINDLFATVTKDELGTGTAIIHAGSTLMAKGGVCYIGDINTYKKEKLDLLLSVLESRNMTLFIPGKKYGDGVDQQVFITVQCNFWSYADLSSKKCNTKEPAFIGQMDLSAIPSHLVDAFGALIQCSQVSHTYTDVSLVQHSLRRAISPGTSLCLAAQQFTTQDFEEVTTISKFYFTNTSSDAVVIQLSTLKVHLICIHALQILPHVWEENTVHCFAAIFYNRGKPVQPQCVNETLDELIMNEHSLGPLAQDY
ncbi:unnamed protein product [Ranitomeya imitator]|uniref:Minichromosome maintenance domain containing 2 n=1 Tax=Ranitomeya imitator TaxID=111125 RepID=A0ABN9MHI3_9NEOB|nr:unnamed protein product [Ranitomeya imitator]